MYAGLASAPSKLTNDYAVKSLISFLAKWESLVLFE